MLTRIPLLRQGRVGTLIVESLKSGTDRLPCLATTRLLILVCGMQVKRQGVIHILGLAK
jgi:hypothetical protein